MVDHIDDCEVCRQLLAALATTSLVTSISDGAADAGEKLPADAVVPETLGSYRLLSKCGGGAYGVVYKAYDARLDRHLAVKVLRAPAAGASTAAMFALLEVEAKAMARLSHPNVVSVYDVGAVGPWMYVAMDFIDGCDLSTLLRQRALRWTDVIALFQAAGAGLEAAHRAGVVHRDFKPQNVLVAADGRVCVSDFGLARLLPQRPALEAPGTVGRSPEQVPLLVVGTPAYMAPEVGAGSAATVQSDVYSFSVALHEALFGVRPGVVQREARAARVPAWVSRGLRWGLEQDSAARAPSVGALLRRIDPHRHRTRTLRAALVIGLLSIAAALVGVSRWASQLRSCAPHGLTEVLTPARHEALRRRLLGEPNSAALVDAVVGKIERFVARWQVGAGEACRAWRAGQQSDALYDARSICLSKGREALRAWLDLLERSPDTSARFLADQALTDPEACADAQALMGLERLPADEPKRLALTAAHARLARLTALYEAGRYLEGLGEAPHTVEAAEEAGYGPTIAEAWFWKGALEQRLRKADAQDSLARAAGAGLAARQPEWVVRAWTTMALQNLELLDKASEAERLLVEAEGLVRGASLSDLSRATVEKSFGHVRRYQAHYQEALAHYHRALELQRTSWGPEDPRLANTLNGLGRTLMAAGRASEAAETLERAVSLQRLAPGGPLNPDLALILNNYGSALLESGRGAEAIDRYREALDVYARVYPPESPDRAEVLLNLGSALRRSGDFEAARRCYQEALERAASLPGGGKSLSGHVLNNLGNLLIEEGRLAEAAEAHQRALVLRTEAVGNHHPETATSLLNLGRVLALRGDRLSAKEHLTHALEVFEKRLGPSHASVATVKSELGALALEEGQLETARALYHEALEVSERTLGPEHPELAGVLTGLGKVEIAVKRFGTAIPILERAHAIRTARPCMPRERAETLFVLAQAYAGQGRRSDGLAVARQALLAADPRGALAPTRAQIETWLKSRGPP